MPKISKNTLLKYQPQKITIETTINPLRIYEFNQKPVLNGDIVYIQANKVGIWTKEGGNVECYLENGCGNVPSPLEAEACKYSTCEYNPVKNTWFVRFDNDGDDSGDKQYSYYVSNPDQSNDVKYELQKSLVDRFVSGKI